MAEREPVDSALATAAGAAGPHAAEAFALLADETRLAVLLALWEAHEPGRDGGTLSFSELFDRVDYDDAGNFSYHLDRLEGQFVRNRDEGYELRNTGLDLVRTVIAGAGVEDARMERSPLDVDCPLCGAPTETFYRDGGLYQVCTACEGVTTEDRLPDGYVNAMRLHPAALADRSPEELFAAAAVAAHRHIRTMFEGLCSACSGPVDAELEACTDHEPGGDCGNCDRAHVAWASFRCRVCKDYHATTPTVLALFHPAVVSFYDDHGVAVDWRVGDFDSVTRVVDLYTEHGMELVSADPLRVEVAVRRDGDELRLTFDETASVVDVAR